MGSEEAPQIYLDAGQPERFRARLSQNVKVVRAFRFLPATSFANRLASGALELFPFTPLPADTCLRETEQLNHTAFFLTPVGRLLYVHL